MTEVRRVQKVLHSKQTVEGAGVHLKRVFGRSELPLFDPFLLFDDFRSDNPDHYLKGFPWHPHRGIETITYVLEGDVEHGDSLGNKGIIGSGDVQWMTAGSGIIHQEMPKGSEKGRMYGFQLWANLPRKNKMMDPRYRDINNEQIPTVELSNGTIIKIIAGEVSGVQGPMQDIVIDPEYLDITIPPDCEFKLPTHLGYTVFAYVIDGQGCFGKEKDSGNQRDCIAENGTVVLYDDGEEVMVVTEQHSVRFLFISGRPLNEPVAWHGPIVMNTQEELQTAFTEYEEGTFIKFQG